MLGNTRSGHRSDRIGLFRYQNSGGICVSMSLCRATLAGHMENLTPREFELAQLVAEGFTNRQIADRLILSRQTVKNHIRAAFRKLQVSNRVELSIRLSAKRIHPKTILERAQRLEQCLSTVRKPTHDRPSR